MSFPITLLSVCLGAALLPAWALEEKETIRQTHPYASTVEVRNVNGGIRVTGYSGNQIELVANKRIQAKTQEALEQAKREVRLDVQPVGSRLKVCIEGVWSNCGDGQRHGCRNDCDREYSVSFDLELRVPVAVALELRSVNGGVRATGVDGSVHAKTVNGGVTLDALGGAAQAETVNGGLHVTFRKTPPDPFHAKTVNGSIEVTFPQNLNATLKFRTLHGEVFTNMPAGAVTNEAPTVEMSNGRRRIRNNQRFSVRVGGGGPEHSFETVNGNIQVKEAE
ncbi:MAG: hypothetical protein JNK87_13275 [Bryobacterales bacterium]|nr:hypothetical protein [Bryobacterales bacterium]